MWRRSRGLHAELRPGFTVDPAVSPQIATDLLRSRCREPLWRSTLFRQRVISFQVLLDLEAKVKKSVKSCQFKRALHIQARGQMCQNPCSKWNHFKKFKNRPIEIQWAYRQPTTIDARETYPRYGCAFSDGSVSVVNPR